MKRVLLFLMALPALLNAQQRAEDDALRQVKVTDNGHVIISWEFPEYETTELNLNKQTFKKLIVPGFGYLHQTGKPDLPAYIDHIATPELSDVNIEVSAIEYYPEKKNILMAPSQPPRQDNYLVDDPPFTMDTAFYATNTQFPQSHVSLDESQDLRDIKIASVQICPFQYNAADRKLKAVKKITVKVSFNGSAEFITNGSIHSDHFAKLARNYFLNGKVVASQIKKNQKGTSDDPNYLIITKQQYLPAAEKLAEWKSQMGFRTEIISQSSWASGQVKTAIHSRYSTYIPKPDYFVIIGDHNDVPGEELSSNGDLYASDHYYSCMGGPSDFTADMAKGRISASSATEASSIVDKIISYEKEPVSDSSFYNTGLNCAYFQHKGGGYAERRFAQTSEELLNYATARGYNVNRVYYTHSSVNPQYWNNTYYSAGEPLPAYLKKPTFAWDGDKYDIINYVNAGAFYVFHRDHGYVHGWGDPAFNVNDVNSFNNGAKTPVFFSINCLTGKFLETECFAEKLLRKTGGGAVGVFAHAEVSYSGYNDALSLGIFDGIWSNPGLVPNFTGSGGISNPVLFPHDDIRTGGDLVNHSLAIMEATWGVSQYTNELFHYFGDPAMEIRVNNPDPVFAVAADSINCSSDSALALTSLNTDSVTATLVVDGKLMGKEILTGQVDTLNFEKVGGNFALLTLSKSGYAPFVDTIYIKGGCPRAKILMAASMYCVEDSIQFSENSFGNITSYSWNFGAGASPASATTAGPHKVAYSSGGNKKVTLTVTTASGLYHTDSVSFHVDNICKYNIPVTGNLIIDKCNGQLFDDGGEFAVYSNNIDNSVTIAPTGASSISLSFSEFHFEDGYDYLKIYDGPDVNSPLIGSYDGNSLPNGGIINSTSNAITIRQQTDQYVNESGFALHWQCSYPNTPPSANFKVSDSVSCTGIINFRDLSIFGPMSWEWDFGDGNTSTTQNPTHQYAANGTYTVKLKVVNSYGADSVIKSNLVSVNMPPEPTAQAGIRCKTGSVQLTAQPPASGSDYLRWFSSAYSGSVLDTGNTFTTPMLGSSRTYYVDNAREKASLYGAKADNTGGGGYFISPNEHHLVFDVHKPSRLISVKVYAANAGNRNIEIRNNNGQIIDSKNVYIPAGENRITLDFDLLPGSDYEISGPESPNLYRNNAGLTFPYVVSDLITIKESSASSDPTGYYYYFYDWEVKGPPCHSKRVKVEAIVSDTLRPVPDFTYSIDTTLVKFNDRSKHATSHAWDFDDGNTSNLPNPDHQYTAAGTYEILLTAFNACGSDSVSKTIQINPAAIETYSENNLHVYPNPASNHVFIELPDEIKGTVVIQLIDSRGRQVSSQITDINNNQPVIRHDLNNIASGAYYVLLHCEEETYIAKVVVE